MLKPASIETRHRCPVALHSDRFPDAPTVRCVRDDLHSGRCALIDGHDLTADAHPPWARYALMGLMPRAGLPPPLRSPYAVEVEGARGRFEDFERRFAAAPDQEARAKIAAAFLGS